MASSHLVSKTVELHEKKDPIRNLWRNVLIIGIEDLLKNKEKQAIRAAKSFSKEEIWFYSDDFKLICEYADIEPKMVKKRTFEAIERIRKQYAQKDMSKMPGQWLYKGKTISRQSSRRNSTMSTL
jgi:flagellar biosynthesis regulator FlbT